MRLFNFGKKKQADSDIPPKIDMPNLNNNLTDAPLPPPEFNEPPKMQEPKTISPSFPQSQNNVFNIPNETPLNEIPSFPKHTPSEPLFSSEEPKQQPIINEPIKTESINQLKPEIPAQNTITKPIKEEVTEESFELPDFSDEEIEEIESLSKEDEEAIELEPEPMPEPIKKIKQPTKPAELGYPKPIIKTKIKEKYASLNSYLTIKDELNQEIKNIRNTETSMNNHNNIVQEKSDKYKKIATTLNDLQDKMIIIDNKLFEEKI